MAKLSDRYYSGREVQRILGITEPALRNLVNQRRLRKITPPGRKTGVYVKEEIDTYAEKWMAFLTGEELPKTTFEIAQPEDMEAVSKLSQRAITPNTPNAEVRRGWLTKNPESCYVVKHNNKIVAFLHLMPVEHNCLMDFINGKIRGWEITPDKVEIFKPGHPTECFVIVASEPDIDETTRKHYVLILLRGLRRCLSELGRRGIVLTNIYATSETPTGIALAMHVGMQTLENKLGKRFRFVLNVADSTSFLLDDYKTAFKQQSHSH